MRALTDAVSVESGGSEFTPLLVTVQRAGLLRRRRGRYAALIGSDLIAFVAVWLALWWLGRTWWALFLAVPAALFTVRLIFVGHDLGHRQVVRSVRTGRVLGQLVGDVILGLGSRWWIDRHTRHHANPNQVGRDPDVAPGPLSWTAAQAEAKRGVAAAFSRQQGRLFFPVLLLESFNLQASSLRAARGAREVALLIVHTSAYIGLLVSILGPGRAAVFALTHHALVGLHLGCAFAPNHKGMSMPAAGERWGFLRKQVLTSRNVRGGPAVDWFLGGLNYQIEHHLFPSMPRVSLRQAQPHVRAHCVAMNIPYAETSLPKSMMLTVRHLQGVGGAATRPPPATTRWRRSPALGAPGESP